jgi:carbonic anhydrase
LIVVLGHSGCGAVAATLAGLACTDSDEANGHLESITQPISRALFDTPRADGQGGLPDLEEAVALNVRQACADLGRESPVLADRLGSGSLRVVGAVYDLESGRVEFVDDADVNVEAVSATP